MSMRRWATPWKPILSTEPATEQDKDADSLGRRQAVSHRVLIPAFAGSNPAVLAHLGNSEDSFELTQKHDERMTEGFAFNYKEDPLRRRSEYSMENNQLVAEAREASTKGAARAVRREGRIPAVLYGEGDPKTLSVDAREWGSRFRYASGNTIIKLSLGNDDFNVLVKDSQEDILSGRVNHIDFYAIHAGQKLHTMVPVLVEGNSIGVREGGILESKIEELEVVCLPKDIPANFTVDISELGVGDSLHVSDIVVPEGVEVRMDPDATLVVVSHSKLEVEPVAEGEEGEEMEAEAAETAADEEAGAEE